MAFWELYYDMRSPDWATPTDRLYRAAVEQSAWADQQGCPQVHLSHHRFAEDGYLPGPFTMASAIGAVTTATRINVTALLLTLIDPVQTAEDTVIADLVSGGRIDVCVGLAYVDYEFPMSGVRMEDRAALIEAKLPAYLAALTGEPFEYEGRTIRVRPLPAQRPRPPVLLGGAIRASARRAARLADGFMPTSPADPSLVDLYYEECDRLGRPRGAVVNANNPFAVHVTEDPERAWAVLGPHALHDVNMYSKWAGGALTGYEHFEAMTDYTPLKSSPAFAVVTPDECVKLAEDLGPGYANVLRLKPLMAGLDPDVGWASLELFASKVLPFIDTVDPAPVATVLPPLR